MTGNEFACLFGTKKQMDKLKQMVPTPATQHSRDRPFWGLSGVYVFMYIYIYIEIHVSHTNLHIKDVNVYMYTCTCNK